MDDAELLCRRLTKRFNVPIVVHESTRLTDKHRIGTNRVSSTEVPQLLAERILPGAPEGGLLVIGVTNFDITSAHGPAGVRGDKVYEAGLAWMFASTQQYDDDVVTLISTARLELPGSRDREWRLQRLGERALARHRYGQQDRPVGADSVLAAVLSMPDLDGLPSSLCDHTADIADHLRDEIRCKFRSSPWWVLATKFAQIRADQLPGLCAVSVELARARDGMSAARGYRDLVQFAEADAEAVGDLNGPPELEPIIEQYAEASGEVIEALEALAASLEAADQLAIGARADAARAAGERQDVHVDAMNDAIDEAIGERPLATAYAEPSACVREFPSALSGTQSIPDPAVQQS